MTLTGMSFPKTTKEWRWYMVAGAPAVQVVDMVGTARDDRRMVSAMVLALDRLYFVKIRHTRDARHADLAPDARGPAPERRWRSAASVRAERPHPVRRNSTVRWYCPSADEVPPSYEAS